MKSGLAWLLSFLFAAGMFAGESSALRPGLCARSPAWVGPLPSTLGHDVRCTPAGSKTEASEASRLRAHTTPARDSLYPAIGAVAPRSVTLPPSAVARDRGGPAALARRSCRLNRGPP